MYQFKEANGYPYYRCGGLEIPRLLWFLVTTSMGWIVLGIGSITIGMIFWLNSITTWHDALLLILPGIVATASSILFRVISQQRQQKAAEAALARLEAMPSPFARVLGEAPTLPTDRGSERDDDGQALLAKEVTLLLLSKTGSLL